MLNIFDLGVGYVTICIVKTHKNVQLERIQFTVCKLYLNTDEHRKKIKGMGSGIVDIKKRQLS